MELDGGECVIMHSFSSVVHYAGPSAHSLDLEGTGAHPKAVMRGFAELSKVETGTLWVKESNTQGEEKSLGPCMPYNLSCLVLCRRAVSCGSLGVCCSWHWCPL